VRAIDTNVLVRLAVEDHERQTAAAEHFVREGAWVSTVALAEAVWVLGNTYHLTPSQIAAVVEMFLNHGALALEHPDTVANALRLFRARPSLGFSDCLILELARKAGYLPLGTFDRRLATAEGAQKL
jgi:predicted nucleic-acid-binding protein